MKILAISIVYIGITMVLAAEPFHWGVNGHPLSQEAYWQVPIATQLDLVAESGAGWYRFSVTEEAFAGNTDRLDELLAGAEQRKLQLLPVLFSSSGGDSKTATPEQIRTNATEFAEAIVSRYKGRITHWELSNELDSHAMIRKGETMRNGKLWQWDDAEGSDPDTYNEVRYRTAKAEIQGLYDGVKAADPSAQTIVDTAGWLHYGFIERLVNEDHVPFDILAWHWYSEMGDITKVQDKRNLIEFLQRYGKPLWITEINRRDGSKDGKEQEQADYVSKTAAQLCANPGIKSFFIYELLDEPYFGKGGESDYGLVELAKGTNDEWQIKRKKAAFEAFKSTIATTQAKPIPSEWSDKVTDADQIPVDTNAWGTLQWVCNGKLMPGSEQTVGLAMTLPGKRNPLHVHPNCEEVLYVISGQGVHSYDGQTIKLKAGMTIRIPTGVKHNLANTGTETLKTLISFSSGDRKTVFLEELPAK